MANDVLLICQGLLSEYKFKESEQLVQKQKDLLALDNFNQVKAEYCFRLLEASRLDHERSKLPSTLPPLLTARKASCSVFDDVVVGKVTNADQARRVAKLALLRQGNVADVFDHLAYFEKTDPTIKRDYGRLSKMHRRRVVALKGAQTVDELRKYQHALSDMLDCKLKQFEVQGGVLDAKLLQKMAFYCTEGIRVNLAIIKDFPGHTRHVVEAEMALAKFYNRFFSPDTKQQALNSRKAIEHYDKAWVYFHCNILAGSLLRKCK